jgi:hypothetical protein
MLGGPTGLFGVSQVWGWKEKGDLPVSTGTCEEEKTECYRYRKRSDGGGGRYNEYDSDFKFKAAP